MWEGGKVWGERAGVRREGNWNVLLFVGVGNGVGRDVGRGGGGNGDGGGGGSGGAHKNDPA